MQLVRSLKLTQIRDFFLPQSIPLIKLSVQRLSLCSIFLIVNLAENLDVKSSSVLENNLIKKSLNHFY